MALTPSNMMPLGTAAPSFRLPATDGSTVSNDDFAEAQLLLVAFICNHCPYVQHIRDELAALGRDYQSRSQNQSLGMVAINSNDVVAYPEDSMEKMQEEVAQRGYTFPYLLDESQEVARAFDAACTPEFYLFDRQRQLIYRGQFDDSRPGNGIPVTGQDLRQALDAALAGKPVAAEQKPSVGCNIKWKAGA